MEFADLPVWLQSFTVLLAFVGLFLLTSWLLDVINRISSKSR